MSAVLALVGSPLLGPAVWRSTAAALARTGVPTVVVPAPRRAPHRPEDVVEHLVAQLAGRGRVVVVVHSNAGLYVPVLAQRLPGLAAAVLADAALPPAGGRAPVAPPGMLPVLRGMADAHGLLPPWTGWWREDEAAALFSDQAARAAVEAEQPRLAVDYFAADLAVPDGWTTRPAAYLRFSEPYVEAQEQAAAWGWPVATVPGNHLHPMADPDGTAAAVLALLRRLDGCPVEPATG